MKKALIAMSGGVDSSVAAAIMVKNGYDCIGATMKLFTDMENTLECQDPGCLSDDAQDAHQVAKRLGFEHFVFDFKQDFEREVISRFVCAYENGNTPNPCIDCNRFIKFRALFDKAKLLGCDFIVTGHYARIEESGGRYLLKKGIDADKDQSYVLYSLTQQELAHPLFPLGELTKIQVRDTAQQIGLTNSQKPDSQDICFVPDGDYSSFLKRETGYIPKLGDFVLADGTFVSKNKGIIHYTVGQRKGLGIAWEHPLYVISKNPENNCVVLGKNEDLFSKYLEAEDVNFIAVDKLTAPMTVTAKTRYSQKEAKAVVYPLAENKIAVEFSEAQRAVTPGQAVVFYKDDYLVGGGKIVAVKL